jgi:excisionase family DNA binding protein
MRGGFSPEEVAEMLGLSTETIRREIKRGKLGAAKTAAVWTITQFDLEKYLGSEERARRLVELFLESH